MIPTPKAEEVAEKLVSSSKWCPSGSYNYNILREMIAEALTAYAEERVKEALMYAPGREIREARAEALEEAARIAEYHSGPSILCAEKIRALKEKP